MPSPRVHPASSAGRQRYLEASRGARFSVRNSRSLRPVLQGGNGGGGAASLTLRYWPAWSAVPAGPVAGGFIAAPLPGGTPASASQRRYVPQVPLRGVHTLLLRRDGHLHLHGREPTRLLRGGGCACRAALPAAPPFCTMSP